MKITFDTNLWQKVIEPDLYENEDNYIYYVKVHNSIKSGEIEPFISETIFTLEGINRKDRKLFFGNYDAEMTFTSLFTNNGTNQMTFVLGPNLDTHPGNNSFLTEFMQKGIFQGFKIMKNLRVGGIVNPDILEEHYEKYPEDDIHAYVELCGELDRKMDSIGVGMVQLEQIGERFKGNSNHWFSGLDKADTSYDKKITNSVAEWADGDTVAMHIAYKHDYLVTNDIAKSAGQSSIFHPNNIAELARQYNLKVKDISSFCNDVL